MLERQSESTIDIAPHSSQRLHMVLCPLGPAAQATRSLGIWEQEVLQDANALNLDNIESRYVTASYLHLPMMFEGWLRLQQTDLRLLRCTVRVTLGICIHETFIAEKRKWGKVKCWIGGWATWVHKSFTCWRERTGSDHRWHRSTGSRADRRVGTNMMKVRITRFEVGHCYIAIREIHVGEWYKL